MDELSKIRDIIKQGRKKEAWNLLNQLLTANPKNEEAWLLAYSLARPESREKIIHKALSQIPGSESLRHALNKLDIGSSQAIETWNRPDKTSQKGTGRVAQLERLVIIVIVIFGCGLSFLIGSKFSRGQNPFFTESTRTPTTLPTVRFTSAPLPTTPATNQSFGKEIQYLDSHNPILKNFSTALGKFYNLHNDYERDHTIRVFQPWEDEMRETLLELQNYSSQLASLSPVPSTFSHYQELLIGLNQEIIETVKYYLGWLNDENSLEAALFRANQIDRYIGQMQYEIEDICSVTDCD